MRLTSLRSLRCYLSPSRIGGTTLFKLMTPTLGACGRVITERSLGLSRRGDFAVANLWPGILQVRTIAADRANGSA